MSADLILPALGESVTEGTITRWLKNVGDTVEVDEPILEVSTDKVDTEIPSPIAGVLEEIFAEEDETVEVGAILAKIGDGIKPISVSSVEAVTENSSTSNNNIDNIKVTIEKTEILNEAKPETNSVENEIKKIEPQSNIQNHSDIHTENNITYITPIIRKLANDLGVNINEVIGTGIGGRIRKEDIISASSNTTKNNSSYVNNINTEEKRIISPLRGTSVKFSRLRKVISERAVESMQQTAQLTTVVEVDVTNIANLRSKIKNEFYAKTGNKLSFLPFFALAAAEALQEFPIINSTVNDDTIIYPDTENFSIAVDTERGLLTPVIRDVANKSISQIAANIADLATRTRNNQLKPDELSGGTFTLTNTGSRGALFDTPVVFLPQSAILGTGTVVKRPVVMTSIEGTESIAIRSMVYLALSYDHRHIDGADAARYLTKVKNRLENANFNRNIGY